MIKLSIPISTDAICALSLLVTSVRSLNRSFTPNELCWSAWSSCLLWGVCVTPDYLSLHSRGLLSKRNRYATCFALLKAHPHIWVHGLTSFAEKTHAGFFFLSVLMLIQDVGCHYWRCVSVCGLSLSDLCGPVWTNDNSRAGTTQTQLPTDLTLSWTLCLSSRQNNEPLTLFFLSFLHLCFFFCFCLICWCFRLSVCVCRMVVGKLQGHKEEALKKKERKLEEKQTRKMRVGNSTLGLKSSVFPRNV